jgi:exodeoxyribonuclease VII large subunit
MRTALAARVRRSTALRQRLEQRDLARRLAVIRTRIASADAKLQAAVRRVQHRADAALRILTGRLDTLSPLAVLARGYAVCWTEDRTAIVRDAASVSAGDRVQVTLARGEIDCRVESTRGE